jgi:hypothetical protein
MDSTVEATMGRTAERIYTEPASVQALEDLVRELPTNSHVRLRLKDGNDCEGVIVERPTVQVYRDVHENEGINGEVRLERPDQPDWHRWIWLDEIERVEHLDSWLPDTSPETRA